MKKILIVHPALVIGGAETVLISYLDILSSLSGKYEVELLLLENRINANIEKIHNNIKIDFILTDIESEFFIYSYLNLSKGNYFHSWFNGIKERISHRIRDKLNNKKFDIIIDFHRNISNFDSFLNQFDLDESIKLIYWIHGQFFLECWKNDPVHHSALLEKYHAFISINRSIKEECDQILKNMNLENKDSKVLYNPINVEYIIEKSQWNKSQDENLLQDDFILQVSRLDEGKNHLEMIDIFYTLKQKGIKEKLYIIGDGEQMESRIREKISSLHLENECLLLGSRDNPFPFMKKAKLFIHTSEFEGLGMVLIESMVCGTPVVAYDCPTGSKEVLENGKYGELIPLHDKEQFVQVTYDLLTDESKRQHYIRLLPEAVDRFNFRTIGNKLENLLDNI